MADDWNPGDLALCLRGHPDYPPAVRKGSVHEVRDVFDYCLNEADDYEGVGLEFTSASMVHPRGYPAAFDARRFRKIHPLTDEERSEFLRELDEPVKQPADYLRQRREEVRLNG